MTGEEVNLGIWNSTRSFTVFLASNEDYPFFFKRNPTNYISLNDDIFKKKNYSMMGMQLPTKSIIINDILGRGLRCYESGNDG